MASQGDNRPNHAMTAALIGGVRLKATASSYFTLGRVTLVLVLSLVSIGANVLKPWPVALIVDSVLQTKPFPEWLTQRAGSIQSSAGWIAALTLADAKDARAGELISQSLRVQPPSPSFASARFHAIRLLMESGKTDEARTVLDQLLKNHQAQFDESSFNLLMSKRMLVATTLDEFLTYAARVPAAVSWNDDGREIPADDETVSTEMKDIKGQPRFDYDAGFVLLFP